MTSFVYDPANPVPTVGGNNLDLPCGPYDQSEVEDRDDVISFLTPAFQEDTAIVGRISATLFVSSNCTDTDFTVKVTDVYPDSLGNGSVLIGDSIQRMRWRDGVDKPMASIVPEQVYSITIELWATAYVFNEGHQLRVDVSSSNYPRFSANPNNGMRIKDGGPSYVALNSVHIGGNTASFVTLPVVPLSEIPNNTGSK